MIQADDTIVILNTQAGQFLGVLKEVTEDDIVVTHLVANIGEGNLIPEPVGIEGLDNKYAAKNPVESTMPRAAVFLMTKYPATAPHEPIKRLLEFWQFDESVDTEA